jgi:hypothetical protein
VIDDNCGLKKFYSIANTLVSDFKISFSEKTDEFGALLWSFKYNGHPLKLQFNIYHGVSITNTEYRGSESVKQMARLLKEKLF